jgi:hypothetical protein
MTEDLTALPLQALADMYAQALPDSFGEYGQAAIQEAVYAELARRDAELSRLRAEVEAAKALFSLNDWDWPPDAAHGDESEANE